ncbi:MAG TPA: hypothetical protein VK167_04490 [Flavipsychrobacter sp.]|nr:hypothetical protein [Flavipsychrobacter sp.]
MKIKSLLYPLAVASVVLSSSCNRTQSSYVQPYCQYKSSQNQHIYSAMGSDRYWGLYSLKSWESCVVKYTGKAFTDLCTSEKNGVKVQLRGKFLDVKAYIKLTENDSVEVKIDKTALDAANGVYSFDGINNEIDLKPYYQHYPGRMTPVLYITMAFDTPYKDYGYMIERLRYNLIGLEIDVVGKSL